MAPSAEAGVVTVGVQGGSGVLSGKVFQLPITTIGPIQACNNNVAGVIAVHLDVLGSCRTTG